MLKFYRNLLVFIAAVAVGVILADASRLVLTTMVEFWEESKPEASANNSPANGSRDRFVYKHCQPTDLCLVPNRGVSFSADSSSIGILKLAVLKPNGSEREFGKLVFLRPTRELLELKISSMRITSKEIWFETENISGTKFEFLGKNENGTDTYPSSCVNGRLNLVVGTESTHTNHESFRVLRNETPVNEGTCSFSSSGESDGLEVQLVSEAFKKKGYFYAQSDDELERRRLGGLMAIAIENYYSDPDETYSSFGTLIFAGGSDVEDLDSDWRFWSIEQIDFIGNRVEIETESKFGKRITFIGEYLKDTGDNVAFNTVVMTGKLSLFEGTRRVESIQSDFSWEEYRETCFM